MGVINRDDALRGLAMKLRQVGRLQVSRILGSVSNEFGAYKALIDLLARSYFLRAEVNALTQLVLDKTGTDISEWQKRVEDEMRQYVSELAAGWPEIELRDDGYAIKDPQAFRERARREGWPP